MCRKWAFGFYPSWRFPRRGGNYNNSSNAGLGYVNSNNDRGNANTNYGARPRSQHTFKALRDHESAGTFFDGRGAFPMRLYNRKTKILYCSARYGKKRQ